MNNKTTLSAAIACAVATLASGDSVYAEESRLVEEVLIVAERRESNLQETAIAVSAFTQETLVENDISDVTDLSGIAPSLVVSGQEDQSDIKIYIRGVGTNNPTETGDQGVGVYVDGVFAARAQGALALMYDLESVQVLRGPQGTLFGRNNTGGALLLQSKKPSNVFESNLQLTYGSFNRQQISGGVTLPLSELLSFRVAAYSDSDDGWVDALSIDPRGSNNSFSGITTGRSANVGLKLNNTDVRSARISARLTPLKALRWDLSFETFTDNGNGGILLNPVAIEDGRFEAFIDSPVALDLTSDAWRSTLSFDIADSINFEYIAGLARLGRSQVVDQDAGVTSRFQEGRTEYQNSDSLSHEIKIQSANDSAFQWTVGWYWFEEETDIRFDFDGQGAWLQGGASFIQPARGSESQAVYAQVNYTIADAFTFSAGARYTDDLKYDRGGRNIQDCNGQFIRPTLGGSALSVFEDFRNNLSGEEGADGLDDFTGRERTRNQCRATLRNDVESEDDQSTYLVRGSYVSGNHLFYGSVSTGYRAGVIQDAGESTDPETSVSYEIGSKSDFGNMRLNLAAFYIDYEDLIRSGFDPDLNRITTSNVAAAEISGLELEFTWLIGLSGRMDFAGSYLKAEYAADYLVDSVGDSTNNTPVDGGFFDLEGNTLPQAPEYQFVAGFRWDFSLPSGVLTPRMIVKYSDDIFFRDENENRALVNNIIDDVQQSGEVFGIPAGQEAYTKVDLALKYSPDNSDWDIDVFVNNAGEEMTRSSASIDNATAAGFPGRYAAPRTYGLRVSAEF